MSKGTGGELSGGGKRYYAEPRTHRRHDMDFYIEPIWTVEALLDAYEWPAPPYISWDPACGSQTIPNALRARGMVCFATDAADRGQGAIHDFLGMAPPPFGPVDNIITNPPYGVAQAFVERALTIATCNVAVLVQAKFCYSQRRHALFTEHPPARLFFLSTRPSMPPGDKLLAGTVEAKGGKMDYLWIVWSRLHRGPTEARWLLRP